LVGFRNDTVVAERTESHLHPFDGKRIGCSGTMTRSCRKSVRRLAISSRIVLLLPRPILVLLRGQQGSTVARPVLRQTPYPGSLPEARHRLNPLRRGFNTRHHRAGSRGALCAGGSAAARTIAQPAEPRAAVRRAVHLYLRAGACGGTAHHLRPG